MAQLPQEFLTRMQDMLGDEFDAFLTSYDAPRTAGLRVNTKKCRTEDFPPLVPGTWKKIPWIPNGYFVPDGMRMGQSPLYAAGVFYLQEPSAMTPASRLPIEPGERVLDLCAAPGGKATELNARLKGTGLLVANDISNARAKALLRNLELFGSENVLVTNETPAGLADVFPGFFDKILVDAPCSGEGMFRKDEAVIGTWTPERPDFFADLQREITSNAVKMLRPGGLMMYSTCTFAPQEDEGTVSFLLENFPEMELIEMEGYEGFSKGNPVWGNGDPEIEKTVRIWPHKMNGEGHYLALFRKKGDSLPPVFRFSAKGPDKNTRKWLEEFFSEIGLKTIGGQEFDWNRVEVRKDKVYYQLPFPLDLRGISFLRNGLYLGDLKKNRFEPSQPLALTLHKGDVEAVISLPVSDERLTRYLKGETLMIEPEEAAHKKGWHLLCVDGYPLGFGKLVNGILKNKYPAGWRV